MSTCALPRPPNDPADQPFTVFPLSQGRRGGSRATEPCVTTFIVGIPVRPELILTSFLSSILDAPLCGQYDVLAKWMGGPCLD